MPRKYTTQEIARILHHVRGGRMNPPMGGRPEEDRRTKNDLAAIVEQLQAENKRATDMLAMIRATAECWEQQKPSWNAKFNDGRPVFKDPETAAKTCGRVILSLMNAIVIEPMRLDEMINPSESFREGLKEIVRSLEGT